MPPGRKTAQLFPDSGEFLSLFDTSFGPVAAQPGQVAAIGSDHVRALGSLNQLGPVAEALILHEPAEERPAQRALSDMRVTVAVAGTPGLRVVAVKNAQPVQSNAVVEFAHHGFVVLHQVVTRHPDVAGVEAYARRDRCGAETRSIRLASCSNVEPSALPAPAVVSSSTTGPSDTASSARWTASALRASPDGIAIRGVARVCDRNRGPARQPARARPGSSDTSELKAWDQDSPG